jgi:epoxyqueuosine reductase QueG
LRLCISYWTTSHQGVIPLAFRPAIGNWLLGCDICQDACPWNGKTERLPQWWQGFSVDPELAHPDLGDALLLSTRDFARKYRQSAFERLGRVQIARNALIVLANTGEQVYAPLVKQAAADPAPVIRATASWALLRLGQRGAAEKLLHDPSALVRAETREALEHLQ